MAKFTDAQIKEHTKKILEVVEKHKQEFKTEQFTAITPEEIQKKLKRVNSPMIVSQGWGGASPGGSAYYNVGLYNPDPTQVGNLFVHVWVGSGNIDPNVGTFLLNVDPRFPRLTQPATTNGLVLAAGASAYLTFNLPVPTTIDKGYSYLGTCCLMKFNWHDAGVYLDRSVFPFPVN